MLATLLMSENVDEGTGDGINFPLEGEGQTQDEGNLFTFLLPWPFTWIFIISSYKQYSHVLFSIHFNTRIAATFAHATRGKCLLYNFSNPVTWPLTFTTDAGSIRLKSSLQKEGRMKKKQYWQKN